MNRSLDGELTADEQLELDRALLRSPEHQETYRQLQRLDDAAASVLQSLFPQPQPVRTVLLPQRRPVRRMRRLWWSAPIALAAAAAVAVFVLPRVLAPRDSGPSKVASGQDESLVLTHAGDDQEAAEALASTDLNRPLTRVQGARFDRRIDRDWIAVRGADGNIYWLEVNRQRTFEDPETHDGNIRLVGGGL
ncbi:MAG: hypothetical protein JXB13_15890 [Phycisphaerae bacterium]|nr:hypothetical protein [Phycisphaerae bacterium]